MSDEQPLCPVCEEAAGDASFSTAPNQFVCSNTSCPIVTWRSDRMPFENTNSEDVGGAAAAAQASGSRKGVFNFPENSKNLIGMFLDDDIEAARQQVHRQIESQAAVHPGAQKVQKAVASIQALVKQAERDGQIKRQPRRNRR